MPGLVVSVPVEVGQVVKRGDRLVVLQAMKMENELRAIGGGTVAEVFVREGQSVEAGTLLAVITPA